jgi:hypothetical protein
MRRVAEGPNRHATPRRPPTKLTSGRDFANYNLRRPLISGKNKPLFVEYRLLRREAAGAHLRRRRGGFPPEGRSSRRPDRGVRTGITGRRGQRPNPRVFRSQLRLGIVTTGASPVAERPNAWTVTSPSMPHRGRGNAVDLRDGLDHRVGSECRRRQLCIGARTSPPCIAVRLGSRQRKLDHRTARGETAGLVVIVPGDQRAPTRLGPGSAQRPD